MSYVEEQKNIKGIVTNELDEIVSAGFNAAS